MQSECRILMQKHADENIVLQAVMDEFEEMREKGNLTAHLLNREKVIKSGSNFTEKLVIYCILSHLLLEFYVSPPFSRTSASRRWTL